MMLETSVDQTIMKSFEEKEVEVINAKMGEFLIQLNQNDADWMLT